MADLVDRLGTVGLWGEAREEILRLRAELTFATQERNAYQGAIDVACKERDRLRAECLRLSHAEAEAMSVVLSLEGQLERLRAEVASSIKRSMKDAADSVISDSAIENAVEKAYWQFDARRKGYAEWATMPQSERDAFKAEGRMLAKGFYPVGKSFVEAERDALRTLLREARPYLNGLGWGKPGVDLPDRIDAALWKEKS